MLIHLRTILQESNGWRERGRERVSVWICVVVCVRTAFFLLYLTMVFCMTLLTTGWRQKEGALRSKKDKGRGWLCFLTNTAKNGWRLAHWNGIKARISVHFSFSFLSFFFFFLFLFFFFPFPLFPFPISHLHSFHFSISRLHRRHKSSQAYKQASPASKQSKRYPSKQASQSPNSKLIPYPSR